MLSGRTNVGLDVHARSVALAGLDTGTGEVRERTLRPSCPNAIRTRSRVESASQPLVMVFQRASATTETCLASMSEYTVVSNLGPLPASLVPMLP